MVVDIVEILGRVGDGSSFVVVSSRGLVSPCCSRLIGSGLVCCRGCFVIVLGVVDSSVSLDRFPGFCIVTSSLALDDDAALVVCCSCCCGSGC